MHRPQLIASKNITRTGPPPGDPLHCGCPTARCTGHWLAPTLLSLDGGGPAPAPRPPAHDDVSPARAFAARGGGGPASARSASPEHPRTPLPIMGVTNLTIPALGNVGQERGAPSARSQQRGGRGGGYEEPWLQLHPPSSGDGPPGAEAGGLLQANTLRHSARSPSGRSSARGPASASPPVPTLTMVPRAATAP